MAMQALPFIERVARRRPAKLAYLLLSLGLSFGFVAVVAAVAHASWFRLPAGVADRDYVSLGRETVDGAFQAVSLADARNVAERVPELSWFYHKKLPGMGADPAIRLPDGATRNVRLFGVPDDFFAILGVQAHVGGLQALAEGEPVAILSHALWRDAFAANADIAGELLHIVDGASVPIAGVASPEFAGILPSLAEEAWLANPRYDMLPADRFGGGQELFQRLANVSLFGAFGVAGGSGASDASERRIDSTAKLRAFMADYRFNAKPIALEQTSSDGQRRVTQMLSFGISPHDRLAVADGLETNPPLRREVVQKIAWLASIVALLMAMTLVSLVDFMMAEHVARQGEQAVRIALGAAPLDVFRQTLAENAFWLAIVAAVAWLAFGYLAEVLLGMAPFSTYIGSLPGDAQRAGLGVAAALLLAAFTVSGAYLSWFASRASHSFSATRAASKLPRAMRCVLLTVAGASLLFVFSLASRYAADSRLSLGLGNPDAWMVQIQRQMDVEDMAGWQPAEGLGEAVAAIPGVSAAGRALMMPLAHWPHSARGTVSNRPDLAETPFFENRASPEFFAALRVPLLAGKMLAPDASAEVVVSRTAAVALAGSPEAAVGMSLTFRRDTDTRPPTDPAIVVGVVEDVPYGNYANAAKRVIYGGLRYSGNWQHWFIDYSGKRAELVSALQQLPQLAGWTITAEDTPATAFRKQFVARQSIEIVLAGASAFALLLALAGVANSLARTVAQAQHAIGIAFALGATASQVAHRYFGDMLRDLLVAVALVSTAAVVAKLAAPDFVAVLAAWQLAPTALCLVAVCALLSYGLVRRLARRSSANALIHGVA